MTSSKNHSNQKHNIVLAIDSTGIKVTNMGGMYCTQMALQEKGVPQDTC
ncbi:MAG: hypothetical protein ABI337_08045 [Nitrososphaera sp.]